MIFDEFDPEVREKYLVLQDQLDGTQPCLDDPEGLYTENWTNRPIPEHVAEGLCGGCRFKYACRDYAVAAQEEYGIWGGTTPEGRKRLKVVEVTHGD